MSECVAFECQQTGVYYFPKDPRLRVLWENATQIPDFCATDTSRLCPRHFKPTDFDYKVVRNCIRPTVSKALKTSAIPSIFTSILKCKEPTKRKKLDLDEVTGTLEHDWSHKEKVQSLTVEIEALDDTLDEDNEEVNNDDVNNGKHINDDVNDVEMSPARDEEEESADDDDDDYQPAKDTKDSDDSASNSSESCKSVPLDPNPAVPMETIWLDDVDDEVQEAPAVGPADVAVNVTLDTTSPKKNENKQTTKNMSIIIKDGGRILTIIFPNGLPMPNETISYIKNTWMTKYKDTAQHVMAKVKDKNKVIFFTYDKPLEKRSKFRVNNEIFTETSINSSQTAGPIKAVTKQLKLVDASKVPPEVLQKLAASKKIGTKDLKIIDASSLPAEAMKQMKVAFPSAEVWNGSRIIGLKDVTPNQLPRFKPNIVRPPPPPFPGTVKRRELHGSGPPPPPRPKQPPPQPQPIAPKIQPMAPKIQPPPIQAPPQILNSTLPKTYGRSGWDAVRLRPPSPVFDDREDDVMYVETTVNTGQPSKPRPTPPARLAPPAVPIASQIANEINAHVQSQNIKTLEFKLAELTRKKKEQTYQNNLLRRTVRSYKKKCDDLRKRLKSKSSLMSAFHIVTKNMTTAAKIFTRMQMEATAKASQGRRYTTEEKILAMSLYRQNPGVYRLMTSLFTLPTGTKLAELMRDADEVADDDPAPPQTTPLHKPTKSTPNKQQTAPNQNHVKLEDQNQIVLHEDDLIILNEDGDIVLQHGGHTLLQGSIQNGPQIYQSLLREGHKEFQGQLENGVLKLGDMLTAQHIVQEEPRVKIEKNVKIERTYQTSSHGQSNIRSDLVFSHNFKW